MGEKEHPTVGLALGGGGVKGLAHVGVIRALEKNNIPIDYISGTSVGSVIGSFYALTKDLKQLEELTRSTELAQAFSVVGDSFISGGLLNEEEIYGFIKKNLGTATFSDAKIPFVAVATSAKTGEAVYLDSGTLARAVRASTAIPPFFSPLKVKNDLLIDGAYSDPVPARILRKKGADIVIAVNLEDDYLFQWKKYRNVYGFSLRSVGIFMRSLATLSAQDADVVITPRVAKYGWADMDKAKNIIAIGEKAARFKIDEILDAMRARGG